MYKASIKRNNASNRDAYLFPLSRKFLQNCRRGEFHFSQAILCVSTLRHLMIKKVFPALQNFTKSGARFWKLKRAENVREFHLVRGFGYDCLKKCWSQCKGMIYL